MPVTLDDFAKVYDPDPADSRYSGKGILTLAQNTLRGAGLVYFNQYPRAAYRNKNDALRSRRFLVETDQDGTAKASSHQYAFKVFDDVGVHTGWYRPMPDKHLDFYDTAHTLEPDRTAPSYKPFNPADYYHGKTVQATDGANAFQCKITIPKETWEQVQRLGAGIGIKQIEGILQQDPVLITTKSKQMGVRCIKPEPYGWVFSTSVTPRLVDGTTRPLTSIPRALVFNAVETGH